MSEHKRVVMILGAIGSVVLFGILDDAPVVICGARGCTRVSIGRCLIIKTISNYLEREFNSSTEKWYLFISFSQTERPVAHLS